MRSQAPVNFSNSEFYGFSEFYYCMEDVLRMGGQYDSGMFSRAAKVTTNSPRTVMYTKTQFRRHPELNLHRRWERFFFCVTLSCSSAAVFGFFFLLSACFSVYFKQ